ncbi:MULTISPECIES: RepB family protein [Lactococcus]|nr:RepB family protein [Lactococcus lactis]MCT0445142.1 RepB family protein [Lactococcus lactis subsp. lactis]
MSKNVKTIKELADELGTNKTRISRIINKNSIPTQKIKNKIVLEDNSVSLIRQYFKNETQQQNETVSILRTELDKAHSHIEKLSNLLDQQQRLALQDKKENQSQEEVQTIKKQMEALNDKIKGQEQLNNQVSKKWYQFWK